MMNTKQLRICILATIAFLLNTNLSSQENIRFSTAPIIEKDLSNTAPVLNFKKNEAVFINFSINKFKKIELKSTERLLLVFKFYEDIQPFEEFSVLASQDENGLIYGNGMVLPSNDENANNEVNTIYSNEFNWRLIDKAQNLSSNGTKKWKLKLDNYKVSVYDVVKKRLVAIDFGVDADNISRFSQFSSGSKFELKKAINLNLELDPAFPYEKMKSKTDQSIKNSLEKMYQDLTNNIAAPSEYLTDDFNGINDEIDRATTEKLLIAFLSSNNQTLLKTSTKSTKVFVEKDQKGNPKYKWFYVFFYAKSKSGKCAYGSLTIRADHQGGGKYGAWRGDTNKTTECSCQ